MITRISCSSEAKGYKGRTCKMSLGNGHTNEMREIIGSYHIGRVPPVRFEKKVVVSAR